MLNPQKHTTHVQLLSRMKGGSPISHNCIYIIHVDQEQLHVNYYCIQGQEGTLFMYYVVIEYILFDCYIL